MYECNQGPVIIDITYDGPFQIPLTSSTKMNIAISIPMPEVAREPVFYNVEYDNALLSHKTIENEENQV